MRGDYRPDLGEIPDGDPVEEQRNEQRRIEMSGTVDFRVHHIAITALETIAKDPEWLSRADAVKRAQQALVDMGVWQRAKPGDKGAFTV